MLKVHSDVDVCGCLCTHTEEHELNLGCGMSGVRGVGAEISSPV